MIIYKNTINICSQIVKTLKLFIMYIGDLDDFQVVKQLLTKEYMLQKDLNDKINERLGKTTKQSNFSCKLKREHLTFKELKIICDILGYDLYVKKRN